MDYCVTYGDLFDSALLCVTLTKSAPHRASRSTSPRCSDADPVSGACTCTTIRYDGAEAASCCCSRRNRRYSPRMAAMGSGPVLRVIRVEIKDAVHSHSQAGLHESRLTIAACIPAQLYICLDIAMQPRIHDLLHSRRILFDRPSMDEDLHGACETYLSLLDHTPEAPWLSPFSREYPPPAVTAHS